MLLQRCRTGPVNKLPGYSRLFLLSISLFRSTVFFFISTRRRASQITRVSGVLFVGSSQRSKSGRGTTSVMLDGGEDEEKHGRPSRPTRIPAARVRSRLRVLPARDVYDGPGDD